MMGSGASKKDVGRAAPNDNSEKWKKHPSPTASASSKSNTTGTPSSKKQKGTDEHAGNTNFATRVSPDSQCKQPRNANRNDGTGKSSMNDNQTGVDGNGSPTDAQHSSSQRGSSDSGAKPPESVPRPSEHDLQENNIPDTHSNRAEGASAQEPCGTEENTTAGGSNEDSTEASIPFELDSLPRAQHLLAFHHKVHCPTQSRLDQEEYVKTGKVWAKFLQDSKCKGASTSLLECVGDSIIRRKHAKTRLFPRDGIPALIVQTTLQAAALFPAYCDPCQVAVLFGAAW